MWESGSIVLLIFKLGAYVGEQSASCCGCIIPGDRALLRTFSGGWLGLKTHLNALE